MKYEKILLFSGGVDSFVAYHYLNKPQTLYFDINSGYTKRELPIIRKLIPQTIIAKVIDLKNREEKDAHIPMRNLYFAMLAVHYSDNIYIAGLKDDKVEDKNKEIFLEFSELLSKLNHRKISIISPFWGLVKHQVVKWYKRNVGDMKTLAQTISCYSQTSHIGNYCGQCASCYRRYVAFRKNGYTDIKFHNQSLVLEYVKRAKAGYYSKERNKAILEVFDEDNRS